MLRRLHKQPLLSFFASCETAKVSPAKAFRSFAPEVIKAGVGAVVAMQDPVTSDTIQKFTYVFYQRLFTHGLVDLACSSMIDLYSKGQLSPSR